MRHFLQAPPCSSRQLFATGHHVSGIQTKPVPTSHVTWLTPRLKSSLEVKMLLVWSSWVLNAKTSKSTPEILRCVKKSLPMIWLFAHIPQKTPRGCPLNKKWNNFLSCIQGSLILAHFVPVGAGPMKFTKASSNQPLVLVVAKKWCYPQMNVVLSNAIYII